MHKIAIFTNHNNSKQILIIQVLIKLITNLRIKIRFLFFINFNFLFIFF